ncbi:MAG: hypothetical protein ACR2GW_02375 [Pyrinomonadaceae bacterium]|nr:hypothetical protein [Acidobacteriota bacterium]
MFLRFVTLYLDDHSHMAAGIFTAAYELKDEEELPDYTRHMLAEILSWFDEYLDEPHIFSRSPRAYGRNIGICWFKNTAQRHLEKTFELAALLEEHNVLIELLKAERPGYVVYEDDYQIVAEPSIRRMKRV